MLRVASCGSCVARGCLLRVASRVFVRLCTDSFVVCRSLCVVCCVLFSGLLFVVGCVLLAV